MRGSSNIVSCLTLRTFTKRSSPLASDSQFPKASVIFGLDASRVANEVRKRGMANSVGLPSRDGGMDRVS